MGSPGIVRQELDSKISDEAFEFDDGVVRSLVLRGEIERQPFNVGMSAESSFLFCRCCRRAL